MLLILQRLCKIYLMKLGFFNLTPEQREYFQQRLTGHELKFIDELLNDSSLPSQTDFDIISVFVKSNITRKVIDHLPSLKMIALRSTGYDNVDLDYAGEKNIIVSNVPSYGTQTVAEFTFALILSLSRRIVGAIASLKLERQFDHQNFKGFDLSGKALGVVGTGKIGANVIKIAKGFGMQVCAYDIYQNQELSRQFDFRYVSLNELLQKSDIVTLHTPLTLQTKHLINQVNISLMKKTAYLINTARGSVVDTKALIWALENKKIAGAALDVLEHETSLTEDENKLLDLENVLVTPHMAFYTEEAERAIMNTTVENILNFTSGKSSNVVLIQ